MNKYLNFISILLNKYGYVSFIKVFDEKLFLYLLSGYLLSVF
jgi:hypothetical protein